MAYTRNWSNAVPPGTRAAKEIDNAAREFRVDIYERLTTVLYDDPDVATDPWDIDPWVFKSDAIKGQATRSMCFGPHIMRPETQEDDVDHVYEYVQTGPDGEFMFGSLPIPIGYKILLFEAWLKCGSAINAMQCQLWRIPMNTGVKVAVSSLLTTPATTVTLVTSDAIDYTVVNSEQYAISLRSDGFPGRCYGFRLTYQVDNMALGY